MTLPDFLEDDADTLLEIEQAAANAATTPLRKPFQRVLALLVALWPGDDASDAAKAAALRKLNLKRMLDVRDRVEAAILTACVDALDEGIMRGIDQAASAGVRLNDSFKRELPESVRVAARATWDSTKAQVDQGRAKLKQAQTLAQAQEAVTTAGHAINRVESAARWATNKANNEGLKLVSERSKDLVRVWRNERTACVHCLAYAGKAAEEGGYPAGLTFGAKPLHDKPVVSPPLHPNCRCTQWLLHVDAAGAVMAALEREAKRSVLRGWSEPSESNTTRIDAAKRLLASGSTLPKSVKEYARKAVKRGEFPRGRDFPG